MSLAGLRGQVGHTGGLRRWGWAGAVGAARQNCDVWTADAAPLAALGEVVENSRAP